MLVENKYSYGILRIMNESITLFGMVIEGDFYRITPVNEYSAFFDLELLHEIGGKNPRKEFKPVAYGLKLDHAINAVIRFAINNKYKDQVITLKDYVNEFKKQKENILSKLGSCVE